MDIFNKKKIAELEKRIASLEKKIFDYTIEENKRKIEELEKKISNRRKYCTANTKDRKE